MPVLNATIGQKSIRDPFVNLGPDNITYHIVTTNSWATKEILYYNTTDFITFSTGQVLPVMANIPNTQCTWAPEWLFVSSKQMYFVFWASSLTANGDKSIWGAWTKDFATFTTPNIIFSPGYTVIDADMVLLPNNTYLLVFKDERDGTNYKAVRHAYSSTLGDPSGPFVEISNTVSPYLTEGPELVVGAIPGLSAPYFLYYDCFEDGHYGVSQVSADLLTYTEVPGTSCTSYGNSVNFPDECRHGSFVPISAAMLKALIAAYP